MTPVADSIVTTLSLYESLRVATLISIAGNHGFSREEILDALADLVLVKRVKISGSSLKLVELPDAPVDPIYLAKADAYRAARKTKRGWCDHLSVLRYHLVRLWPRISHAAIALVLILLTAGGLVIACAATAKAVEVPDRIVAALVQVESGCEWRGMGEIRGTWLRGADGEVSPFQLSPAVLISMGAADRTTRIHRDPVLAESFARLWLSRCFDQAGTWEGALARYNAGSRHRSRTARDYATRVLALARAL